MIQVTVNVYPVHSLRQVVDGLNAGAWPEPVRVDRERWLKEQGPYAVDFKELKGQPGAKRALEVAAAGGHNVLIIGPPGSGKTLLARRLPTILPPMTFAEAMETTQIHSVAGSPAVMAGLIGTRPFRSPHHTISYAGLTGGGSVLGPGEVSLAHNGVLFLDELPEFPRHVLEVLRLALEGGTITIARALRILTFPARFLLIAAMNPCPCGHFGSPLRECSCSPLEIQRYITKISGPLLDRIDIHIDIPVVPYKELARADGGEPSEVIRARVIEARHRQQERFRGEGIGCNAQMGARPSQIL